MINKAKVKEEIKKRRMRFRKLKYKEKDKIYDPSKCDCFMSQCPKQITPLEKCAKNTKMIKWQRKNEYLMIMRKDSQVY